MDKDEYWNKFISDGKIESYLNYKQQVKSQDGNYDGTNAFDNRRPDNSGTTNR